MDAVITITNDIAPAPGVHRLDGLRVQANSPVQVHHVSWTQLLTTAVALKQHKGVSDPEQAWILDELIRYLEHPASGALQFDDMGPNWVSVRSDARDDRLTNKNDGPDDIAQRWDQLLRYIALTLGAEIGEDVQQVIPRKHSKNPKLRHEALVTSLCDGNRLEGVLRIPNTAGDIDIMCDLRAAKLTASLQIDLADDRGGKARGTWLAKQLPDAAGDVWIEVYEQQRPDCDDLLARAAARGPDRPVDEGTTRAGEGGDQLVQGDGTEPAVGREEPVLRRIRQDPGRGLLPRRRPDHHALATQAFTPA